MRQQQMQELLGVPERTLRDWKKSSRSELYKLLETIDYNTAKKLLAQNNNNDLRKLLENEQNYDSERDFERDLYEVLTSGRSSDVWLKLSNDTTLSKSARARASYLYSFLTRKPTKLSFKTPPKTGFYYEKKKNH